MAVSAKKQEIDNNENAIQEEKDAAKTKVDEEATKAKAAIDQASTNNGVDQAKHQVKQQFLQSNQKLLKSRSKTQLMMQ